MPALFFLICSAGCLLLSVTSALIVSKLKYKRGRILEPSNILLVGILLSAVLLFIPMYIHTVQTSQGGWFETLLGSVHSTIRLFVVDGEYELIITRLSTVVGDLAGAYAALFAILFVAAPVMTFGFVLSFFKNLSAYKRYFTNFFKEVYVFSELNEKTLALASSLYKNDSKKRLLVFTEVFGEDGAQNSELVESAKEIGAICFKKDITSIQFSFHSKKHGLTFFAAGEDQSHNVTQALALINKLRYREHTNLYVFSTQSDAEILLANAFNAPDSKDPADKPVKIRVRRVNEVHSLVTRNLYENGYEMIFRSAHEAEDGIKHINALVVGMGQHGTEMTKSLAWFGQMDGYQIRIHSFDSDPLCGDKFCSLCPELMDPKLNGAFHIDGESKYEITIHPGINVDTKTFDNAVTQLPQVTYVFVCLGNDEKNIATAIKLRMLFQQHGYSPKIQAVVSNSGKKAALTNIRNFKNQEYNIDFIGDINTSYSEAVVMLSDVEAQALKRHLAWGDERAFWQYDYNYKSSLASAIHRRMKELCKIPGITKPPAERTEAELWAIRKLEHCRWNAYMRSEGYVYGGTVERAGRNDLAKMHNCLVPFAELPLPEQIKDDN